MTDILNGASGTPETMGREDNAADRAYMDRAIDLAWLGAGKTKSNPLVGAVVVADGKIVGEGYHAGYGLEHAEAVALAAAGPRAAGGTLYVTLEPCTHYGKTPPCVDRIVSSGVRRVCIGTLDPDARVYERGVDALRKAGIEVSIGHRAARAVTLNVPYLKRTLDLGATVTLKMAITLDGRIAARAGSRDAVTGADAQRFVHRLRATHCVVLVGAGTAETDRPRLDTRRLDGAEKPMPAVIDPRLRLAANNDWLARGGYLVVASEAAPADKARDLENAGVKLVRCKETDAGMSAPAIRDAIKQAHGDSVFVEGGGDVFTRFLSAGAWDALHVIVAPLAFGPDGVPLATQALDRDATDALLLDQQALGDDVALTYLNRRLYERLRTALWER